LNVVKRGIGEKEQRGGRAAPFSPFLLLSSAYLGWVGGDVLTFNVSTFSRWR
jgi:hypothetical protein